MLKILKETLSWIRPQIPIETKIGIILGTGLGELTNSIINKIEIPYEKIPHFPISTVKGHDGKLVIGQLGGKSILAMQGRFHYYEGYNMKQVTYPVRLMQLLGLKYLFISNAAGGMNSTFQIGDIMLIEDHINFFPEHPLRGKNFSKFGPRFPDMSQTYDKKLRNLATIIAKKNNIKLQYGIYVGVQGPTFETPAEYHYFKIIGGDAVGMSTIPEVIVARHGGLKVLAFSVITDLGIPGKNIQANHENVQKVANDSQPQITFIIKKIIKQL